MTLQGRRIPSPCAKPSDDVTWTFFRQWLKNPLKIAALSPSSRRLARRMLAQMPPGTRRVIELGGGTGVFTKALLDHGIAQDDLLVVELNAEFHALLQRRFPGVRVVRGDARELGTMVEEEGFARAGEVDAVISGLGMLSMSRDLQRAILDAAFRVLGPEGRFIQFTYGPVSPISRELTAELGLTVRRGGIAWRNVPPASVFVFSRSRTTSIKAIRPAVR
ncbi:class I SAM-dependent methyltransferase [Dokdonella sp. MW10]|uniref:class I SAM-dependent methyltransferase n=1 Tax=Dokdonella sp. MW10 TaxID=2992926 RepID=UPI003F7EAF32